MDRHFACILLLSVFFVGCGSRWTETETGYGYNLILQKKGQSIAYCPGSGVGILTADGYAFKDLNRNGILDPYEDWRLSARERAQDLASKLSIEEIAGMMLYSSHQSVPSESWSGVYDGKIFAESSAASSDLSDSQKKFLTEDNLRAVLVTTVESPAAAARWNNNMQMLVEGMGCGVPVNISSDPRHETSATAEYNYGSGGDISHWPTSLGLAATFDPALVEELTVAQRHYECLKAGVDQFGGNNDKGPVLEAYRMWVDEFGQASAERRFRESACRLLMNSFRTGLFENPYLDPEESEETVGNPEYMEKGYQAQLKSVVMLKNSSDVLPVKPDGGKPKVYVPKKYYPSIADFFGRMSQERWEDAFPADVLADYYEQVSDPSEADFAIVVIDAPTSGNGWHVSDVNSGGTGYLPISLQYNDYTADHAREVSIAGGDRLEDFVNRSYRGKSVKTANKADLQTVMDTKAAMGEKPVITVVNTGKPFVPEFEPYSDAILVSFGCQNQAILDLISGAVEPSALLPMQLPADMKTVELQKEDVPFDMECYVDAEGNTYGFAFGLNWSGRIDDARVKKYRK